MFKEFFYNIPKFEYLEIFLGKEENFFKTIDSDKTPIVLVPGYKASFRSLTPMKEFLESKGYPVYFHSDLRNFHNFEQSVQRLVETVHAIDSDRVQIVAHSMGGVLTLKAMLEENVDSKISNVVTMGTPYCGAILGTMLAVTNERDYLVYGSEAMKELLENVRNPERFKVIHSAWDEVVFPEKCRIFDRAAEVYRYPVGGHANMLFDEKLWGEVLMRLVD